MVPLQFSQVGDVLLQFIKLGICYWNTSFPYLDPSAAYVSSKLFGMDEIIPEYTCYLAAGPSPSIAPVPILFTGLPCRSLDGAAAEILAAGCRRQAPWLSPPGRFLALPQPSRPMLTRAQVPVSLPKAPCIPVCRRSAPAHPGLQACPCLRAWPWYKRSRRCKSRTYALGGGPKGTDGNTEA